MGATEQTWKPVSFSLLSGWAWPRLRPPSSMLERQGMKRYEKVKLADIRPYRRNAKVHPQRQIDQKDRSVDRHSDGHEELHAKQISQVVD